MKSLTAVGLALVLVLFAPALAQKSEPVHQQGAFMVKDIRGGESPWLLLAGKRVFLYRLENRGTHPVEVWSGSELKKGAEGKATVRLAPDEAADLMLEADSYLLRLPEGGKASGVYALLKVLQPEPKPEQKPQPASAESAKDGDPSAPGKE